MTVATPKRPTAGGRDSPNSPSPSRQPRASTPNNGDHSGAGTAVSSNGVGRTRSARSGTVVSARAAAAQRRESLLSSSTTAVSGASAIPALHTAASTEAEEAVRAETLALLDDLKERLSKAESVSEQFQRQNDVLQARLDEAVKEHSKLEERAHEYDEQTETLKNEKREMARQMQHMETIYEAERSAMTREKEDMSNREEEMQRVIQRLKDSLAQRNSDDEGRPSRISSNNSTGVDSGSFAPPSSLHRSDSRNNSKLLLQKDKLIESLRLELAEAQIKLVETENQGGGRLHEVERQLMEARMANARLMEDNESYQLLLQEKTLKGDFGTADFGFGGLGLINSTGGTHSRPRSSNEDALNALEGRVPGGNSLADELNEAAESDTDDVGTAHSTGAQEVVPVEVNRRLVAELKSLQDQNKALTLFINKIIERLLEHQDYQYILDKSTDGKQPPPPIAAVLAPADKDLPPPPPEKTPQPSAIQSFLQRTKSITARTAEPATNAAAAGRRPRPVSYIPQEVMNNPETAPSIPISLTRSTSVRRPMRPMSEQFSGSGGSGTSAASVVNAMYKGGGVDGPLSPGLRSSQFFGSGTYSTASGGSRSPGIGGPGSNGASGNFPGMRSETSSVSGDSTSGERASGGAMSSDTSPSTASSNTQNSPPRPVHEKTAFTGSKPRPLRLVQENPDSMTPAANKRASWMGWWAKKDEAAMASPTLTSLPASAPISADSIQE